MAFGNYYRYQVTTTVTGLYTLSSGYPDNVVETTIIDKTTTLELPETAVETFANHYS
jgi:hypothetical protein